MVRQDINLIKLTLSPTKVDTFNGCQRLFYYRYISKPFIPPETPPLYIGNVIHATLQAFHEQIKSGNKDKFSKLMKDCFKKSFVTYKVKERLDRRFISMQDAVGMKLMLKSYVNYIKKQEELPEVYQIEKLNFFNIGGVPISLKADRIDKLAPHVYRVVDYKTSNNPPSRKEQLASVQIQSYGIMIRSMVDKQATVYGDYIYLKHLDKKAGVKSYKIDDAMMEKAKEDYKRIYATIMNGCKYHPNRKYKYCGNFCEFRHVCVKDTDKIINED